MPLNPSFSRSSGDTLAAGGKTDTDPREQARFRRTALRIQYREWMRPAGAAPREYLEVIAVLAAVTIAGWYTPISFRVLGHVYLLVVILLSVRVGRWPALFAAVVSGVAWDYVFIPPRMSFSLLDLDEGVLLGSYFLVAIIAGQLTARIRAGELEERQRERRATALFHLTRALSGAHTLDEAVELALRQADALFDAQTALLLVQESNGLELHRASSLALGTAEWAAAEWAARNRREAGRFAGQFPLVEGLFLPLVRGEVLGVFVVRLSDNPAVLPPVLREVLEGFAAQIALMVERERLRAAGEREKFFAESDRLHRTLLDSVSHELKTPLAVLRSAGEKLATDDPVKRVFLLDEVRTATSRLDHLVANLLNQTRLESGGLRPDVDWCNLREIVGAARRAIGNALAGREFLEDWPADLPLCRANEPLMEQAVVNLLLNVARHTPAGSPLQLSAGRERLGDREWIFLRVADRGPGLPVELREDIFRKFQRGPTAPAGGLGLGLSIVRGFVQAQGGEVVAGDNPGGGAIFTIYLPYLPSGDLPEEREL